MRKDLMCSVIIVPIVVAMTHIVNVGTMNKDMSMHEYMQQQVNDGYINEKGAPLKCQFCESTRLSDHNRSVSDYGVLEYEVFCDSCDKKVGHWAYGNWTV